MRKIYLPEQSIVQEYLLGKSSIQIASKFKVSKPVILRLLHRHDVTIRNSSDARRKNNLNVNFFDSIDSEEKAYWLGFLLADGNIQYCGRNRKGRMVRIALQKQDREHLLKLRTSLKSSHDLVEDKENNAFWFKFTSAPLARSLESKGWHEFKRKGETKILEDVPKNLQVHLIRGLIDGDGCISRRKNRSPQNQWIIHFVDLHRPVTEWVKDGLQKLGATGEPKVSQKKNNRCWGFMFANSSVPLVLDSIYTDASVYLTRKRDLAFEATSSILPQK